MRRFFLFGLGLCGLRIRMFHEHRHDNRQEKCGTIKGYLGKCKNTGGAGGKLRLAP